jgi:hypothetical protein
VNPVAGVLYWSTWGSGLVQFAGLDGMNAAPLAGTAGAVGVAVDRKAHHLYWTSRAFDYEKAAIRRAGPAGIETLVVDGVREPRGIAVEPHLAPMAATGRDRSVGPGFDSFVRVVEAVPATEPVGSIGSGRRAVKDVDVDPTTGAIYTVDLLPGLRGQQVYAIDPATGRGTPLPERTGLVPPALVWGLAFDAGGTLYGGRVGVCDRHAHGKGDASRGRHARRPDPRDGGLAGRDRLRLDGLLLGPSGVRPYVAEHAADRTFLAGRVLLLADPGGDAPAAGRRVLGRRRALRDHARQTAAPPQSPIGRGPGGGARSAPGVLESLAAAGPAAQGDRPGSARREGRAGAGPTSLLSTSRATSAPVAAMTRGAPLRSRLLGLGRTMPESSRGPRPGASRAPVE